MFLAQWVDVDVESIPVGSFTWVSETRSSRPRTTSVSGALIVTKPPNIHARLESRPFGDYLMLRDAAEDRDVAPYAYRAVQSTVHDEDEARQIAERAATELPISGRAAVTHGLRVAGAAQRDEATTALGIAASLVLIADDESKAERGALVGETAKTLSADETEVARVVERVEKDVPKQVRQRLGNTVRIWR